MVIQVTQLRFYRCNVEMSLYFYCGSGGSRERYLEINIDHRSKIAVTMVMDEFISNTTVAAVMRTKHCVWGGNDFLAPM